MSADITAYMDQVRKHPVLSREREVEITCAFANTRDLGLRQKLVAANLGLVVKIAHEYRLGSGQDFLDMVQEGNVGLVRAVEKFNPRLGVKLCSYASWWIRAHMLQYIMSNFRLMKLGTNSAQRKLFFNLRKVQLELEMRGVTPTAEEVGQVLSLPAEAVSEMESRLGQNEQSTNMVGCKDENVRKRLDGLRWDGPAADEVAERNQLATRLVPVLNRFGETLLGRERDVFYERLLADDPLSLQELGDRHGITREAVRQTEVKIRTRLERYLRRVVGEDTCVSMCEAGV